MTQEKLRILRTNEVSEMLGISRATLWRWARQGLLPPKRIIGPNSVGWFESEILGWLESRPKQLSNREETKKVPEPRSEEGGSLARDSYS